jgi:hypothetical protein
MLTTREKKSKILFSTEELLLLREALKSYIAPYYSEDQKKELFNTYGILIDEQIETKRGKLEDKVSKILEASRVWDFEGFEYRP